MIVNLHIESLVLDGVAGGAGHAARIAAAVQAELARLWSQPDASSGLQTSLAIPALRGAPLAAAAFSAPSRLGHAVATSLYGAIAK